MTTPCEVNRALKDAGFNVRVVRNQRGGSYYYFIADGFDAVPSIYTYSLGRYTTEEVVEHVRQALPKGT